MHNQNKLLFPASNLSNILATIDYETQSITENDYSITHVFETIYTAEPNNLHTLCEVEAQLLTTLSMTVKNPQLVAFLSTQNCSMYPLC